MTVERGVLSLARFMPESKMLLSFPCYWWEKKQWDYLNISLAFFSQLKMPTE